MAPVYTLRQLVLYFLKPGTTGFGGPVALVGYMHRDLVARIPGVTAAAIGAIIGAAIVLGKRQLVDGLAVLLALLTIIVLQKFKKIQEPYIILAAALCGWLIKTSV